MRDHNKIFLILFLTLRFFMDIHFHPESYPLPYRIQNAISSISFLSFFSFPSLPLPINFIVRGIYSLCTSQHGKMILIFISFLSLFSFIHTSDIHSSTIKNDSSFLFHSFLFSSNEIE